MKLAVTGAAGRMGKTLIQAITDHPDTSLSGALEHSGSPLLGEDAGTLAGIGPNGVAVSDDVVAVVAACDGVIDFSVPEASCNIAHAVAKAGKVHVIGTTGCTPEQDKLIAKYAGDAVIVKSGNMSLGVNLLSALVAQAAKALGPDAFDIEVLEMHHRHKVDAPSGTALLLGAAAAKGRGIDLDTNSVKVRDGITGARDEGSIGFATLRGGGVVGTHKVLFAGEGETIELGHVAQDRSLFANGALKAALWAKGRNAGLYDMHDVLGLKN